MLHQRKANRLKGYNYSRDNLYFVTSCVQDRVCCFGKIVDAEIVLNDYGKIVNEKWHWLAEQYPYVVLHEFVVMPDHIHGIIEINRDCVAVIATGHDLPLSQMKIKSLSELMGAYKTGVSKQIHLTGYNEFKWQRSFHDHIIRDDESYERIANYILNNPTKWQGDKFNKKNYSSQKG